MAEQVASLLGRPPSTPRALKRLQTKVTNGEELTDADREFMLGVLETNIRKLHEQSPTSTGPTSPLARRPSTETSGTVTSSGSLSGSNILPTPSGSSNKRGYRYHMLLHYHKSDQEFARKLYGALHDHEVEIDGKQVELRCQLDEDGDSNTVTVLREKYTLLETSMLFVPIISAASLLSFCKSGSSPSSSGSLTVNIYDSVLRLHREKKIAILPVTVGVNANGVYEEFNGADLTKSAKPAVPAMSEAADVAGPEETIRAVLNLQPCLSVNPSESLKPTRVAITDFFKSQVWPSFRRRMLVPFQPVRELLLLGGAAFSRPNAESDPSSSVHYLSEDQEIMFREHLFAEVEEADIDALSTLCDVVIGLFPKERAKGEATMASLINSPVPSPEGGTSIHLAVEKKDIRVLRKLLEFKGAGVDLEILNNGGLTPVILATFESEPELMKVLCEAGADINAKGSGPEGPPVQIAARMATGSLALRCALEHGGDPNSRNMHNWSITMVALDLQLQYNAFLLLQHGARIDNGPDPPQGVPNVLHLLVGSNALSPQMLAVALELTQRKDKAILAAALTAKYGSLLSSTADVSPMDPATTGLEPLSMAVAGFIDPSSFILDPNLPPDTIARSLYACIALLLAFGADPFQKNGNPFQESLLHQATRANSLGLVKLLLKSGGKRLTEDTTNTGDTPLIWAARCGHDTIIRALLDSGADPNRENQLDGATALHAAVAHWAENELAPQFQRCVEELLKDPRTDVTKRDKHGRTGWHMLQMLTLLCATPVPSSNGMLPSVNVLTPTMIRLLKKRGVELPPHLQYDDFEAKDWVLFKLDSQPVRTGEIGSVMEVFEEGNSVKVQFPKSGNSLVALCNSSHLEYVEKLEVGDIVRTAPIVVWPKRAAHPKASDEGIVLSVELDKAVALVHFHTSSRPQLWRFDAWEVVKTGKAIRIGDWVQSGSSSRRSSSRIGIVDGFNLQTGLVVVNLPPKDNSLEKNIEYVSHNKLTVLPKPPFSVGDRVCVPASTPIRGQNEVSAKHVGIVVFEQDLMLEVQFPHMMSTWIGYPSELQLVRSTVH